MKFKMIKRFAAAGLAAVMTAGLLAGCGGKTAETNSSGDEIVELTWWQIGDAQKDQDRVIEKVNEYIRREDRCEIEDQYGRLGRL